MFLPFHRIHHRIDEALGAGSASDWQKRSLF